MKMKLSEIARVVGAHYAVPDPVAPTVTGVAFDTRKLHPGDLFVPITGERDGHDFIGAAERAGAVATFVQAGHAPVSTALPQLVVPDPLKALNDLARYYLLMKVNPKVVAITGSNGKTTTKDMTAAILATQYHVIKTQDNYNNEIGVPMTILSMDTNTEVLVVEMGMDRPGQLDALSKLVEPDVAVITMIGEAHIEFFKTRDKIADAKMEITHGLKEDGLFIYNGDEPLLRERAKQVDQDQKTFGLNPDNILYARDIVAGETKTDFSLSRWPDLRFSIPMMGEWNVANALAAILVGRRFHIKPEAIQAALKDFPVTKNRTQWVTGDAGEPILSDVYNANPTAMKAVLNDFAEFPCRGRRIAVLGDMLELGDASAALHASVAAALDPQKIQEVYLYGDEIVALRDELAKKYAPTHLHYFPKGEQRHLIVALEDHIVHDDLVMLKASHGLHLEKVLQALIEGAE
ncbi:UDP-N-acetylmuramoyl-tripeptide--D-alanyl-D-alanine ligase [Lacticaseibacillus camelliae]|uniref:UDP-N-acetylmuramoyl-tripeptide--D-alanyl-D-alanine ligase n=1 Tax=Lacticaseibacillus camelliae DSM 22697 = JCM 13995 TaxID=1423730 RepID=A0A0R2FEV7_9LACO|nr:UDP-N-acetylmuramoyl-tripeptide--D-alanyl-D-alanine ligase [Lacticaseibacillus camelliae]KRN25947.1 UDP-N-acetylmuramyl pentapeptide synthase [Lacticaseibacillus camelliae DSM 22697 = JCM 13995]